MPTTQAHLAFMLILFFGFAIGTIGIDIDHLRSQCNFLTQKCKIQGYDLLWLHRWIIPLFFLSLSIGWLLHLILDSIFNGGLVPLW